MSNRPGGKKKRETSTNAAAIAVDAKAMAAAERISLDRAKSAGRTCALCGEAILRKSTDPIDRLSMDHVPPQQFYPREIRVSENPNLWTVPTHRRCNESFRQDEDYFYHVVSIIVADRNPRMGAALHRDLMRRTSKPQTPALMRSILKTIKTVTDGGIILPSDIVQFGLDEYRVQRVAIKIAQGVLYRERLRHFARESCCDIRLCLDMSEVPEMYQISWSASKPPHGKGRIAVLPAVFSYHVFELEGLIALSMLFWESLMFCTLFDAQSAGPATEAAAKARLRIRLP